MTKYFLFGFWLCLAALIATAASPESQALGYVVAGVCVVVGVASVFVKRL